LYSTPRTAEEEGGGECFGVGAAPCLRRPCRPNTILRQACHFCYECLTHLFCMEAALVVFMRACSEHHEEQRRRRWRRRQPVLRTAPADQHIYHSRGPAPSSTLAISTQRAGEWPLNRVSSALNTYSAGQLYRRSQMNEIIE
jgi:hypothetical protein